MSFQATTASATFSATLGQDFSAMPAATSTLINQTVRMQQYPGTNMVLVRGAMKWVYVIVGCLGMINNLVVMAVVLTTSKLRHQPRNWFIFHQSVADFASAVFVVTIALRTAVTSFSGVSGYLVCALWASNVPFNATSLVSAYILAAFTIEVYMAIVHPVRHRTVFTVRLVSASVAAAWAIGIGYPLGLSLGITRVVNGNCMPYFLWSVVGLPMGIVNFIVKLIIPVIIYLTCYILTFISLQGRARVTAASVPTAFLATPASGPTTATAPAYSTHPAPPPATARPAGIMATTMVTTATGLRSQATYYSRASHNVAVTVFYTLVIHIVAWTGNQVQVLLTVFGNIFDTSTPLYQAFLLAIYANCFINPIIYVVKYREFRKALKRIICRRTHFQKSKDTQNSTGHDQNITNL